MFKSTTFVVFALALVLACLFAGTANAVQVVYTFEQPDSGKTVTDRALSDGAQDPIGWGDTGAIDPNPANAAFGSQSGLFPGPNSPGEPSRSINTGITAMGLQFTLAAMINDPDFTTSFRRVFSSLDHGGDIDNDMIMFVYYQ